MRKLWLCLFVSACGGGLERVSWVTDQLSYDVDGRVLLSLSNVSATDLKVNLCLSRLMLEDGTTPGPAGSETCDLEGEVIAPGTQRVVRKTVPAKTSPGRYRYETTIVLPSGVGERVLTPVFTLN